MNLNIKHNKAKYTIAVITGKTTKSAAYLKYINPNASNPAQAAWRFEHTKSMQLILDEVRTEIEQSDTLRKSQLALKQQALSTVSELLSADNAQLLTDTKKLSILRLAVKLTTNMDTGTSHHSDMYDDKEDEIETPRWNQNYNTDGIII